MISVAGIAFLYDVSCLSDIFDWNLSLIFKIPAVNSLGYNSFNKITSF